MENICQSCGLTMNRNELHGTNKDGTKNNEYCKYCFNNGQFNKPNESFEEMVESCIPFEIKEGITKEEARNNLEKRLSQLKRWS